MGVKKIFNLCKIIFAAKIEKVVDKLSNLKHHRPW